MKKGNALIVGLVLAAFLAGLAMAFANRVGANQLRLESDIGGSRSLELAQTGANVKAMTVWAQFKNLPTSQRVPWLGGEDANGNGILDPGEDANVNGKLDPAAAPTFSDTTWTSMGPIGDTCTRVKVMGLSTTESWTDIRFTTWARVFDNIRGNYCYRKIQRTVRYSLGAANVFDYVYFANNYGWMYGTNLNLYGPMGANGNLGFSGSPLVDGPLFAAKNPAIGAAGIINGTAAFDNLAQYQTKASANPLYRPTNPAGPGIPYAIGYSGTQPQQTAQTPQTMPTLGDLSMYQSLANTFIRPARPDLGETGGGVGSVVKQLSAPGLDPTNPANYTTYVNRTYGYNGETGFMSNVAANGAVSTTNFTHPLDTTPGSGWKNGNVALIGTPQQPIVILGPVVVSNDLVIKGTVTGQGTFYVGRNTHVVGDLTYAKPPAWTQNDSNFNTTATTNQGKDCVGFGVKGNVVLGNYTLAAGNQDNWGSAIGYIKPPFTAPYAVDPTDVSIGYGNGTASATFNGDYTALDGGMTYNTNFTSPGSANRTYYQSAFPAAYINSIAVKPSNLQGVFYTNHYFGGRVQNMQLYGCMVARDEAIVTDNSASFIWDPRISKAALNTYINLFLPRAAVYQVVLWKESPADDPTPASPDW